MNVHANADLFWAVNHYNCLWHCRNFLGIAAVLYSATQHPVYLKGTARLLVADALG